jgi:hypothetical protein
VQGAHPFTTFTSTSISTLKTLIPQQQKLVVSKTKRVTGGKITSII